MLPLNNSSHRRLNLLTGEWVLVSPQRAERPWQGQVETASRHSEPAYDPSCYLCPGNTRAGGKRNPSYASTYVFDNDYPAIRSETAPQAMDDSHLLISQPARGICRVGCFSPRHDLTLSGMSQAEIVTVIEMWREQFADLGKDFIKYVQIFENRGVMMGASNPHPHCQIWADAELPNIPEREQQSLREYRERHAGCLLCRYLELELARKERIVCANDGFVALVPFWAVWPFETMVLSRRHAASLVDLSDSERFLLADLLRRLTIRYDNLFESPFPYSMGFHQSPTDGMTHEEWHLHAHYVPPLLRSATVRKFMVGYELLATPQRDLTPETAAERLRDLSETHYLDRKS